MREAWLDCCVQWSFDRLIGFVKLLMSSGAGRRTNHKPNKPNKPNKERQRGEATDAAHDMKLQKKDTGSTNSFTPIRLLIVAIP